MYDRLVHEDAGYRKVWSVCDAMHAIWRRVETRDLGVDGQIEFLEPGNQVVSTGQLLAVQVKSGPSYFESETDSIVRYYPSDTHRRYWRSLNLPIIIVLHHPGRDLTLYADVKRELRRDGPIEVSRASPLTADSRDDLLRLMEQGLEPTDPEQVLQKLHGATLELDGGNRISGIEFLLTCVNPEHTFFELRMCRIVSLIELAQLEKGFTLASDTYDFILRCVIHIWSFGLTEPFVEEFERVWYGQEMVPDILVALTPVGSEVMSYLASNVGRFLSTEAFGPASGRDADALARAITAMAQRESDSMSDRLDKLGEHPF